MKNRLLLVLIFIPCLLSAQNGYYFFTESDISQIRSAAKTEWGKSIIESLKDTVEARREYPLTVPLLEGGHIHDYFCPEHKVRFSFDWNKPEAHYCSQCKHYWTGNKRYDWAWVNVAHTHNYTYLRNCMYLYLATGNKVYAEYIRNMLLDYASKYITYLDHDTARKVGPWGGKMFGQSLDESAWASDVCRAYMVAKSIMTTNEIREIEKGYLIPCSELLLRRRGTANWQVWHNSGLIALGVALENDSIINVAINDPECGYHAQMERYVMDDGWWGEGSPTYHYYPLRAMLLSADAVRCRNINLYGRKLYKMLAAPASGVYADLYFPAHNDGWYGESLIAQVSLYEIAYQRYNKDPFFLSVLQQCYRYTDRNFGEALQNNIEIPQVTTMAAWPSVHFKETGYAVLRSGTKTVVMKYGPHGGGHGHPDKLSISIHDGEKEIVSDMGTCAYGVPTFTKWYRKTLSHSTLTVDAKDQKESTGKLLAFKAYKDGGEVSAEALGAYSGVAMERRLILKKNKLTDILTARSDEQHLYDYVLMLTERPVFSQTGETIILNDSPSYNYIKNAIVRKQSSPLSCKIGKAYMKIEVPDGQEFEVIMGEAPGIPPGNGSVLPKYDSPFCYPLIVRVKDKKLRIKTEWKF